MSEEKDTKITMMDILQLEIQEHARIALNYKEKIEKAKTEYKRTYYKKKLEKNNRMAMKILLAMEEHSRLMKVKEQTSELETEQETE